MEAVEVQILTFLTSATDTVERSTANRMAAIGVQKHPFLTSPSDTV